MIDLVPDDAGGWVGCWWCERCPAWASATTERVLLSVAALHLRIIHARE